MLETYPLDAWTLALNLPGYHVTHCAEDGIDGVLRLNIPPSPANYAQRSGRTGWTTRMGITAGSCAVGTALALWSDITGVTQPRLAKLAEEFPGQIKGTLIDRGQRLAQAAEEVRKLGEKIKLSPKEEDAQKGYRELAIRLREDNKYSYLPRVLAEAGLLPGYSFSADPGRCRWATTRSQSSAGGSRPNANLRPGRSFMHAVGDGGSSVWHYTGLAAVARPARNGSISRSVVTAAPPTIRRWISAPAATIRSAMLPVMGSRPSSPGMREPSRHRRRRLRPTWRRNG